MDSNPFSVLDPLEQSRRSEIEREQISHPMELYRPGSERLEKLYAATEKASRFSWPPEGYKVNV